MPAAPNDALLKSYVPADLAAAAEGAAGSRGISVSQLVRDALRREVGGPVDELDETLLARLLSDDPAERTAGKDELLGLNVVSLAHRMSLRDTTAEAAALAFASLASPERNRELICALVAAIDRLTMLAPCVDEMAQLAASNGRTAERLAGLVH